MVQASIAFAVEADTSVTWRVWRRVASESLCASGGECQELIKAAGCELADLQVMSLAVISTLLLMIAFASSKTCLVAERTISICFSTPRFGGSAIAFHHRPAFKSACPY